MEYIENLDFYDVLYFNRKIKSREESKAKAELRKLQMLTMAIHTGEPEGFINEINNNINNEPSNYETGDLEGLEKLKHKRESYRR